MKLLAARRFFAVLAVVASLLVVYFTYTNSRSNTSLAQAAGYAMCGIVFAIMAIEERSKNERFVPVAFPLLSLGMFGLAVWACVLSLH